MKLPKKIDDVIHFFQKIPGVGPKTALRQSLVLTKWKKDELKAFSMALDSLSTLERCEDCGLFSEGTLCHICSHEERKSESTLCVVENISDFMAIESSRQFMGVYHVLGGVLNPLLGIGPDELQIDRLIKRIKRDDIKTVILAVNPSVEGDATCSYIRQELIGDPIKVERIGFGVPMGGSLEYLDVLTISKALEYAREI